MTTKTININTRNGENIQLELPWGGQYSLLLGKQVGATFALSEQNLSHIQNRVQKNFSDIEQVLENLPIGSTIVDIGAGNSIIDAVIEKHFAYKNFKYLLVDNNDGLPLSKAVTDFTYENTYAGEFPTYNSWKFIEEVIRVNSLSSEKFAFCNAGASWQTENVQLIMSFSSCGWHFPIRNYATNIVDNLQSGGYFYVNPLLNVTNDKGFVTGKFGQPQSSKTYVFDSMTLGEHERSKLLALLKKVNLDKNNAIFSVLWKR